MFTFAYAKFIQWLTLPLIVNYQKYIWHLKGNNHTMRHSNLWVYLSGCIAKDPTCGGYYYIKHRRKMYTTNSLFRF